MKKKKLLFIINSLEVGGAEKALLSLLNTINYDIYEVDVQLFKHKGLFLKQLPNKVNLLPEPPNYKYFDMPFLRVIKMNLLALNFKIIYYRILFSLLSKFEKNVSVKEQKGWKYLKKIIKPLNKDYDVAIGFLEKTPNYFCVDKVSAIMKVGFIMNDYNKLAMDKKIDALYFSKLDYIIQDSLESNKVMIENFPQFKSKFFVLKSIINQKSILNLSLEKVNDFPSGFNIISIGRLTHQKGYDLAIEAIKVLIDKGLNVNWVILGEGEYKHELQNKVVQYNLQKNVFFLGIKENHYPYLMLADIFLHTARFEGFGIVVHEAKILKKPMVLTNFNVARTHISNNYNGLISEFNPQDIAQKLEQLINNKNLRDLFSQNLSKENFGTENEIENFYKLINPKHENS